ncbi:MAG: hypothetical protein ABH885_02840 [Candidatus Omnitrophota bacterium]
MLKLCPGCGKQYDQSWSVCLLCNVNLVDDKDAAPRIPEIPPEASGRPLLIALIIIVTVLLCFGVTVFAFLRFGPEIMIARELARTDIPAKLIGSWRAEFSMMSSNVTDIITYTPDGSFSVTGSIADGDNVIKLSYSGKYRVDGTKIAYVITDSTNPDTHPIGEEFSEKIWHLDDNFLAYYNKNNDKWYRERVRKED